MSKRPICPTCGKPLPKLTTTVWIEPERGQRHMADSRHVRHLYLPRDAIPQNIADCRRLTNLEVVSVVYHTGGQIDEEPTRGPVWRFGEWDGESYWSKDRPFCKPDCALAFARAAYRAGYRMGYVRDDIGATP